jgi:hypothetical protein
MNQTSEKNRMILAISAVVVGLFCAIIAPIMVQTSLDRILTALLEVVKDKPQFNSGIVLFGLFYPIWRALIFVAGITLLAISPKIYQGEEWTFPVAMLAYTMPSMGGMFMFLPYVSWVEGFPIPMLISLVGLVGFTLSVLLRHGEKVAKLIELGTLLFIGMLATHSFTLGIGSVRMLMTRPGKPLFQGLQWSILTWVGQVDWIATILLIIAIPLIVMRKRSGWWFALIAALSALAIDAPTQIIRTATLDYLYGSLLSLGLLLFLFLPAILEKYQSKAAEPEKAVAGD